MSDKFAIGIAIVIVILVIAWFGWQAYQADQCYQFGAEMGLKVDWCNGECWVYSQHCQEWQPGKFPLPCSGTRQ